MEIKGIFYEELKRKYSILTHRKNNLPNSSRKKDYKILHSSWNTRKSLELSDINSEEMRVIKFTFQRITQQECRLCKYFVLQKDISKVVLHLRSFVKYIKY